MRVVLDTNVVVSALLFGGKPREVLMLAIGYKITAVVSPVLLAELSEVLAKKFCFPQRAVLAVEDKYLGLCLLVRPPEKVTVLADEADNRVLEAAVAGKCQYIITGDKELLRLGNYQKARILSPEQFLKCQILTD